MTKRIELEKVQCHDCQNTVYVLWIRTKLFFGCLAFHWKGKEQVKEDKEGKLSYIQ